MQMVLAVSQGANNANASVGGAPPSMSVASVSPDYFRATERPDDYQNLMERLDRKFTTARTMVPAPA